MPLKSDSDLPMAEPLDIFSNDEETYKQRVREIEEYYVRTLLESENDEDLDANPQQLERKLSRSETSSTLSSPKSHFTKESSWPKEKPTLDGFNGDFAFRPFDLPSTDHGGQCRSGELEVKINFDYGLSDDPLPLTTENLEKLSLGTKTVKSSPHRDKIHIRRTTSTGVRNNGNSGSNGEELNRGLYKTELCESFTTRGVCRYGSKCQFAHGLSELKFRQLGNNFRTKPCINWTKLGYCPYGKRCCFKHGSDQDIKVYLKAGTYLSNVEKGPKNLHAHVKALQKITW